MIPIPQVIIQNWIVMVDNAVEALRIFRAWLQAWHDHPLLGRWPSDAFDAVIDDLRQAGLGDWLDEDKVKSLKTAVCGGENEPE